MLKPFMSLLGVMALMFVTAPPNVAATRTWLVENVFSESHGRTGAETGSASAVARFAPRAQAGSALCATPPSLPW